MRFNLRACLENRPERGLRARRGGWRGSPQSRAARVCSDSTSEHPPGGAVSEEQRSQPPRPAARPPGIFFKHALNKRKRRAFTLIEVLAAMLFMAIVIPVAMEGLRMASLGGEVAQRKMVAARLASKIINELK